ncbi:heterokaryon incompatibility protein-domain-containing protein [Nemania serpens]|nr:heterokaryon incompatibility protein-domain-containing protein [Nemania serpens]
MDTFKYQQLDLKSSAFRLVRLLGGSRYCGEIHCEIVYTTLDDNVIPYEAVSYTWGTSDQPFSIIVETKIMMVTSNLWGLLRDIRQMDTDRYLWIDAISINQNDNLERGHQVQRMQAIYSGAERVLFYLGEMTGEIQNLMNSLSILQSQTLGCRWEFDDPRWKTGWDEIRSSSDMNDGNIMDDIQRRGLEELLARPWFRRVWILHTNVEVLVWKPPGLEVLASKMGVPHATSTMLTFPLTPSNLDKINN